MKKSIFKGKSTRTKLFSALTAVGILVLICLNFLLTYIFRQNVTIIDLTPEGFYTVSDKMMDACTELLSATDDEGKKREIEITFCCEPDYLIGNDHLRVTYFMALALQREFENVTVITVDAIRNPTALAKYKTTSKSSIGTTDIIFSYGSKYRVVNNESFWFEDDFSYNGEYRTVSILSSLLAVNNPAAYFVTDFGCSYFNPSDPDSAMSVSLGSLYDLLTETGLKIKLLDLSETEKIPEDCVLLIVNDPREDFVSADASLDSFGYVSEVEKIDRYLVNEAGALIVNKGYNVSLPVFESFMSEWGIGFGDAYVVDKDNCLDNEGTTVVGVYDTGEDTVGQDYYGEYSKLSSSPKMIFKNAGYVFNTHPDSDIVYEVGSYNTTRIYNHFIGSSDTAIAKDYVSGGISLGEGRKTLAVLSARSYLDSVTAERTHSYVFATCSREFFSNELLGNPSYANYSVMATVVANISRTERYASIELGGGSGNSPSYGGKQTVSTTLSEKTENVYLPDGSLSGKVNRAFRNTDRVVYTVIIAAVPVTVLCLGIAVYLRRKFL